MEVSANPPPPRADTPCSTPPPPAFEMAAEAGGTHSTGMHPCLCMFNERDNPYYFFPANQQKAGTKIYSLTPCSLSVNECD